MSAPRAEAAASEPLRVIESDGLLAPRGTWTAIADDEYLVDATWTFRVATEVDCGICGGTGYYPKPFKDAPEFSGLPCDWCDSTGIIYLDLGEPVSWQLIDVPGEFEDVTREFAAS